MERLALYNVSKWEGTENSLRLHVFCFVNFGAYLGMLHAALDLSVTSYVVMVANS